MKALGKVVKFFFGGFRTNVSPRHNAKKILFGSLAVLALAVGLQQQAEAITNYIKNPGFEIDTNNDGIPDNWRLHRLFTGMRIKHPDIPNEHCVKLEANHKIDGVIWIQDIYISLESKKEYVVKYSVKADVGQQYRVYIEWFREKDGKHGGSTTHRANWQEGNGEWEKKTFSFSYPEGMERPYIVLQIKTPGKVLFDDVSITEKNLPVEETAVEEKGETGISITLHKPHYRDSIFSSYPIETIEGYIKITNRKIKNVALTFGIEGKKMFYSKTFPVNIGESPFSIPARNLDVGTYDLKVKALSNDGSVMGEETKTVRKLPPAPVEVTVRKDNILLVNGKPFFPIHLWHAPPTEKALYEVSKAGFNLFRAPLCKVILDKAAQFNMKVIGHIVEQVPDNKKERMERGKTWKDHILKTINHPALLGYFLSDEPLWGGLPLQPLIEAYNFQRQIDPFRPIWISMAPRGTIEELAKFAYAADIFGVCIYPVPEEAGHSVMEDRSISSVGRHTVKMRATVDDRKPIWMALQGFAWAHYRHPKVDGIYPTWEQTRFMAYDAIIHGATGITYWGTQHILEPEFWKILFRIASELRDMSPVFVSKTVTPSPVKVNNQDIVFLHKLCEEGNDYIIAANRGKQTLRVSFDVPFSQKELYVIFENQSVFINDGSFTDTFGPHEVHIYSTSRQLPPPLVLPPKLEFIPDGESLLDRARIRRQMAEQVVPYEGNANWIWYPGKSKIAHSQSYLRRSFTLLEKVKNAQVIITADDDYIFYVNGKEIGRDSGWGIAKKYHITPYLRQGKNVFAAKAKDGGIPPCGFLMDVQITTMSGKIISIVSDDNWVVSQSADAGWNKVNFNDKNWQKAEVVAPFGYGAWGKGLLVHPGMEK